MYAEGGRKSMESPARSAREPDIRRFTGRKKMMKKGQTMCRCKHETVCRFRSALLDAYEPCLQPIFGGFHKGWGELGVVIRNNCRFRTPAEEGEDVES